MERKKIIELIKLEVLGCLNEKDRENLQSLKLTEEVFPWKELAEYQLIAAMLPSVLETTSPASELKDKTAMKLYNVRDEIKAKIDAKKEFETVSAPVEEKIELEEKAEFGELLNLGEKIEVEENVAIEAEEGIKFSGAESTLPKEDPFKLASTFKEKSETENFFHSTKETVETPVPKHPPDKEIIEKITRDYINSHLSREIGSLKQNLKQNRILSYIFFAITLILLAVIFIIK